MIFVIFLLLLLFFFPLPPPYSCCFLDPPPPLPPFLDSFLLHQGLEHGRVMAMYERTAAGYHAMMAGELGKPLYTETLPAFGRACLPDQTGVVDVGCGSGEMLGLLRQTLPAAIKLYGVEPCAQMRELARAQVGANTELLEGTATALPAALPAKLGGLLCCFVLHHVPASQLAPMAAAWAARLAAGAPVLLVAWVGDGSLFEYPDCDVKGVAHTVAALRTALEQAGCAVTSETSATDPDLGMEYVVLLAAKETNNK